MKGFRRGAFHLCEVYNEADEDESRVSLCNRTKGVEKGKRSGPHLGDATWESTFLCYSTFVSRSFFFFIFSSRRFMYVVIFLSEGRMKGGESLFPTSALFFLPVRKENVRPRTRLNIDVIEFLGNSHELAYL